MSASLTKHSASARLWPSSPISPHPPADRSVAAVFAAVGEAVARGDCLVVIEAMKVEPQACVAADGRIDHLAVQAGDTVVLEGLLARITPATDTDVR